MSKRNRKTSSSRRRRSKRSNLVAAIIIEAIAAIALFGAIRFAQDVRRSSQQIENQPTTAGTTELAWTSNRRPSYRTSDLASFTFGDL